MKPWMGHNSQGTEMTAAQIVLSLMPEDGSPVTWGDLKRRAKKRHHHLSPSTLSKHLKRFARFGEISREEAKTGRKLPTVFYRKVVKLKPTIKEIREIQEKAKEKKEFGNIAALLTANFCGLSYRFARLLFDASKQQNVKEAKEFVLQMLDASIIPYILGLTETCYEIKDVGDRWSVLQIADWYFFIRQNELLEKLKKQKAKSARYQSLQKKLKEDWELLL